MKEIVAPSDPVVEKLVRKVFSVTFKLLLRKVIQGDANEMSTKHLHDLLISGLEKLRDAIDHTNNSALKDTQHNIIGGLTALYCNEQKAGFDYFTHAATCSILAFNEAKSFEEKALVTRMKIFLILYIDGFYLPTPPIGMIQFQTQQAFKNLVESTEVQREIMRDTSHNLFHVFMNQYDLVQQHREALYRELSALRSFIYATIHLKCPVLNTECHPVKLLTLHPYQLEGQTDAVRSLRICDGKLYTGSEDKTVMMWDMKHKHEHLYTVMCQRPFISLVVSSITQSDTENTTADTTTTVTTNTNTTNTNTSNILYIGTAMGGLEVWSDHTKCSHVTSEGQIVSGSGILSVTGNDVKSENKVNEIFVTDANTNNTSNTTNNSKISSEADTNTNANDFIVSDVTITNTTTVTSQPITKLTTHMIHGDDISHVIIDTQNHILYTASKDKTLKRFNLTNNTVDHTNYNTIIEKTPLHNTIVDHSTGYKSPITGLDIDTYTGRLFCAHANGWVSVYDIRSGSDNSEPIHTFQASNEKIYKILIHNSVLFTCSNEKCIKAWTFCCGEECSVVKPFSPHTRQITINNATNTANITIPTVTDTTTNTDTITDNTTEVDATLSNMKLEDTQVEVQVQITPPHVEVFKHTLEATLFGYFDYVVDICVFNNMLCTLSLLHTSEVIFWDLFTLKKIGRIMNDNFSCLLASEECLYVGSDQGKVFVYNTAMIAEIVCSSEY